MKKIFFLFVALLLAAVLPAQAQGLRTVTYTFKGRADGYILPARPIDLVASGNVPAGVKVSKLDGFNYGSDPAATEDRIDRIGMDGFLGSALATEYIVAPSTVAHVHFDGFRYAIKDVKWNRCSEIRILTSKGRTWVTDWLNGSIGSWEFQTEPEDSYSTLGEIFYHTSNFLREGTDPFTGLRTLNIACDSKQANHGIAVRSFIINYYEPVITITGNSEKLACSTAETIGATITQYKGAFTDAEIKFKSSNTDIADIDENTGEITTKSSVGRTVISAYIEYGGALVTKTNYILTVGDADFEWRRNIGNVYTAYKYGTGVVGNESSRDATNYVTGTNSQNGLVLNPSSNQYKDVMQDDLTPVPGQLAHFKFTSSNSNERAGVQQLYYDQQIPAYSSMKIAYDFTATMAKETANNNAGAEIIYIGTESWPNTSRNFNTSTDHVYNFTENYTGGKAVNNLDLKGAGTQWATTVVRTNPTTAATASESNTGTNRWKAYNKDEEKPVNKETGKFVYFMDNHTANKTNKITANFLALEFLRYAGVGGRNQQDEGTFAANGREYQYTYYTTVTFDANGGTGTMTKQSITSDAEWNKRDTQTGEQLNTCTYTQTDYNFIGWNTDKAKADAGEVEYVDGADFCAYDADNACGKGPVTLYAVWKKQPKLDLSDPDPDADYLVYVVWGNGGIFTGDKDHLEGLFVTGSASLASFEKPSRTGYTFKGFWDNPADGEDGIMLYDANGARVINDATTAYYFMGNTNWKATADVHLYAKWQKNTPAATVILSFDPNGGTMPTKSDTHPYNGTQNKLTLTEGETSNNNVSIYMPTYAGYKFAGWYTAATGGEMAYNANGESVVLESMSKDPVTGMNVASLLPVNEDFFNENYRYVGDAAPFNANFTLYAHWIPEGITITFNEGGQSKTNAATYAVGSDDATGMDDPAYELAEYDVVNVKRTLKTDAWNTVCFPCDIYKDQVSKLFSEVKQLSSFEISEYNDVILKFKKVNVISAGVPYFVKMNDDLMVETGTSASDEAYVSEITGGQIKQLTLENVQVNKVPGKVTVQGEDDTEVIMYGSYTTEYHIGDEAYHTLLADHDYYYLQDNKFYKSGGEYTVTNAVGDKTKKTVWGNLQGFRIYLAVKGISIADSQSRIVNFVLDLDDSSMLTGVMDIADEGSVDSVIYDLSGRRLGQLPKQGLYIANGKKYIVK